jgi:SAM-dependent methyltransferase
LVYTFKPSAWSSHSLLLSFFPPELSRSAPQVLDVGCGDGYLGSPLAARGYQVTGLERSGGFSEAFPSNVKLIVADLEQGLPPLDEQFDRVICADILEHLRSPESLLRQLRQVMAPGAQIIASLPNSGNFWFRLNILLGRFPQEDKGLFDRTHVRFFMWDGWLRLFADAGFRIVHVEVTPVPFSLLVPPGKQSSLPVRLAESVFYGLAHIWKTLFAYQFVIVAESARE